MRNELTKTIHINDMCQNHSFLSFLLVTKKYYELISRASVLVVFISVALVVFFSCTINIEIMNDMLRSLFSLLVPAYIGVIGFLFSGLALMSAIITQKALKIIDEQGKIKSVTGILFSCYYCGALILGALGFGGIFYLYSYYQELYKQTIAFFYSFPGVCIYWIIVFFNIYLTIYSLLYTVSLLGSCIKFFFVNVKYNDKGKDITNLPE